MIFFTSDTHFYEKRLELFYRPFKNTEESDTTIIRKWNETVRKEDEVYFLGDFIGPDNNNEEGLKNIVSRLNGKIYLIKGNYDTLGDDIYKKYFISVNDDLVMRAKKGEEYIDLYLNHYPNKCRKDMIGVVGHVHGLWKVQRNSVNVGCDAWHFKPVSINELLFIINAIKNHFDDNVFAGELECNLVAKKSDK